MYHTEKRELDGRSCTFLIPEGQGPFPAVLLCGHDPAEILNGALTDDLPPVLWFSADCDWSRDYSPWPAPGVRGGADFTGGGAAHLRVLEETVLPVLRRDYPVLPGAAHLAAMGYSLGGLFALWALYQSDAFGAAASLSGSLWFDGWADYAQTHAPAPGASVYLSLGRSEERAGDPRMGAVGDNTRRTYELLRQSQGEERVMLEWNRGGHFTGIPNRWNKALRWLLPRLW